VCCAERWTTCSAACAANQTYSTSCVLVKSHFLALITQHVYKLGFLLASGLKSKQRGSIDARCVGWWCYFYSADKTTQGPSLKRGTLTFDLLDPYDQSRHPCISQCIVAVVPVTPAKCRLFTLSVHLHIAACMLYTMQFTALVVLVTFAQVQMGASTGAQLPTFNHSWDQMAIFWFSANTTGPEVLCTTHPALVPSTFGQPRIPW
jgi:hypothetical protein